MRDPQEALEAARRAAVDAAAGTQAGGGDEAVWGPGEPARAARRLAEWAIIEPDEEGVYSTRPLGRPITLLKRLLVRLMRQYVGQMSAQQSRFNATMAAHVVRLEERVAELEEAARRRP